MWAHGIMREKTCIIAYGKKRNGPRGENGWAGIPRKKEGGTESQKELRFVEEALGRMGIVGKRLLKPENP